VDPAHPDDPNSQIQLSTRDGTPLAWSSDGSKLLILRTHNVPHQAFPGMNLFVLNADGTETRLTKGDAWITGGSFSPDGSEVVYAADPGIFVVEAGGATPPLLLTAGALQTPTFSPDGSRIAYFAWRRQRFRLQVMNADGTGSRALSHAVSFEDLGGDPILV
jgi:Tol biopolymer transport system component